LSLNTAAWSVSVELFFYVVFPVLLFVLRKRGQLFILFTVVMFLSSQLVFFHYFKNDYADIENFTTFLYHPLLHVASFMTGMLAGWCFKRFPLRPVRYVPVPLLLLVLVIVILGADSLASVHFAAGMLAPVFALLILYIAIYNPVLLKLRPLVFLGEISYGVYILQFPVYKLLDVLNVRYVHLPPTLLFYISLVVLCSVAAASYYWFEIPVRRKVNNWLARD
jgi:peptidoglycan/LPS O-acetylase OafA/YrhL